MAQRIKNKARLLTRNLAFHLYSIEDIFKEIKILSKEDITYQPLAHILDTY